MSQTDNSEQKPEPSGQDKNPVEALRDEFQKQFASLKASFDNEITNLKSENESLKTQNNDLQRALIRSATVPDTNNQAQPKSEEDLYRERIQRIAESALKKVIV